MKFDLKEISKNIFPGFVVSLVALPLGLGLALAAGVPPIAGVTAAIVGGIVVSVFGGSHVTIAGPGNALAVATFSAVLTLGGGDLHAGYLFALGAIVCSGVLIYLLGLFRFGALSNLFPTAAVQGMLAAIGIIIMAGQLHVMLGEASPEANSTVDLLGSLPKTIGDIITGKIAPLSYIIGLVSLLIMVLYSALRSKFLHLIPAPMWIVLIGIGISYFSQNNPHILTPLPPDHLVIIPENIFKGMSFPDFGKVGNMDFWMATLSLTLIASIESLLSIKAVDKLDPENRRSNANKDMRALGIATVASGLLGGLNVVTVIARSSVNVNNGARTRWSNLFHALFLLLFILVFTPALKHIPMPALAAILVYTGYKLAAPSTFIKVAKVGWEQLLIFVATMLTTIFTNLIIGICIGMAFTLLLQLRAISRIKLFARYLLRPNTILYQESQDQYLLSVKAYSNFINFLGLKNKLDSIPTSSKVIVDFSLAKYIDHSVLEQLHDYHDSFRVAGGDLEIIGIDDLGSHTSHPLAPRMSSASGVKSKSKLSRRQKAIRLFSKRLGWQYNEDPAYFDGDYHHFEYFSNHRIDHSRNRVNGMVNDVEVQMADMDYHEGEFIVRENLHSTMVVLKLPYDIPKFVLDKENLLDKVAYLAGFKDINFAKHPDFSNNFKLKGNNKKAIHQFFNDDLIDFLQANKLYHIESNGQALLIFEKERLSVLSEIKQLVSFASRLADQLSTQSSK